MDDNKEITPKGFQKADDSTDAEEAGTLSWLDEVEWTDPEGNATVTNPEWLQWKKLQNERALDSNMEEPDEFKDLSYAELGAKGMGWKLHLNFDPKNEENVYKIKIFLYALRERGLASASKIGLHDGQSGKEATVYVGHKDKAVLVAGLIERGLGDLLMPPGEKAIEDDTPFSEHLMGRFETTGVAHDFAGYGAKGHSILKDDFEVIKNLERAGNSPGEIEKIKTPMVQKADEILRKRFGEFYTGRQAA